jgi:hypothetical protein
MKKNSKRRMTERQWIIHHWLAKLGDGGTTRQIGEMTGFKLGGINRTLKARGLARHISGSGADSRWGLVVNDPIVRAFLLEVNPLKSMREANRKRS